MLRRFRRMVLFLSLRDSLITKSSAKRSYVAYRKSADRLCALFLPASISTLFSSLVPARASFQTGLFFSAVHSVSLFR